MRDFVDGAIGDDRHETRILVAGDSQRQGCAVSLVVVAAMRKQFVPISIFARCPTADLGGSVCQNPRCQFVAVHEHERVGWVAPPAQRTKTS